MNTNKNIALTDSEQTRELPQTSRVLYTGSAPAPAAAPPQANNRPDIYTARILHARNRRKKRSLVFSAILLLCLAGVAVFCTLQLVAHYNMPTVPKNSDKLAYIAVLGQESEQDWQQDTLLGTAKIKLNTRVAVPYNSRIAEISLANPPASAYSCRAQVVLEETGEEIYASELLLPGTVVQNIELPAVLPLGEHKAVVCYQFYDSEQKEQGTYNAEITIVQEDVPLEN